MSWVVGVKPCVGPSSRRGANPWCRKRWLGGRATSKASRAWPGPQPGPHVCLMELCSLLLSPVVCAHLPSDVGSTVPQEVGFPGQVGSLSPQAPSRAQGPPCPQAPGGHVCATEPSCEPHHLPQGSDQLSVGADSPWALPTARGEGRSGPTVLPPLLVQVIPVWTVV